VLSPAPTRYIILLLWRDIAFVLKVPLNPKQTNKQTNPGNRHCCSWESGEVVWFL